MRSTNDGERGKKEPNIKTLNFVPVERHFVNSIMVHCYVSEISEVCSFHVAVPCPFYCAAVGEMGLDITFFEIRVSELPKLPNFQTNLKGKNYFHHFINPFHSYDLFSLSLTTNSNEPIMVNMTVRERETQIIIMMMFMAF